jgi:hypothetical protein
MNNTFDLNRFSLLFAKHTKEHAGMYLMSLGVLTAIIGSLLGFITYNMDGYLGPHIQAEIYTVFMIISGTIFTTMIFSDYGDKKKAIPLLTLPVSHFEKYLVGWLYSYLLFIILYTICFYCMDALVIGIANLNAVQKSSIVNVVTVEDSKFFGGLLGYTFVQAVCFAGAIFYQQWHFVKTGFTFFASAIAILLINQPIVLLIFGKKASFSPPFNSVQIREGSQHWSINADHTGEILSVVLLIVLVLLLWTSAYFKLKEKEV